MTTISCALTSIALIVSAAAEVRLPHLFSTGAVFQRDRPVAVWGWGEAGKTVTVGFSGQSKATQVSDAGTWQIHLDPMPANADGSTLTVSEDGSPPVAIEDILVGEVWLASGQSNMEWPVSRSREEDQKIAASASNPHFRIFNVPNKLSPYRLDDCQGDWKTATPETIQNFSAIGYFFGRELSNELKVPIGVIASEWGGSRIEPWTPKEGFAAVNELGKLHQSRLQRLPGSDQFNQATRQHLAATRTWLDQASDALDRSAALPPQPAAPAQLAIGHNAELGLYQAMIHPLVPYSLRGFIWYQGESNLVDGMHYRWLMEALIAGWRKNFDNPEAPFLFVQLAPFNYGAANGSALPKLWTAQSMTLDVPHTGMAIINDIGNPGDIHPRNKSDVAHRLALLALADSYGKSDLVKSGPLFNDIRVKGNTVVVSFDHAGSGLKTRDGKAPDSFEIAGLEGEFRPALATIKGNKVSLTSAEVEFPTQARFAWSQIASPNLVNSAGLPASAFHSHWPYNPDLGRNAALGKPHQSSDPNPHRWDSGLTDGTWDGEAGRCFATGDKPEFPKHATIDLGTAEPIHAVRLGTPAYGSTKSIVVSVSKDGDTFEEIGRHEFKAKTEERVTLFFDARPTRFIRVSFIEQHPQQDHFSTNFGFIREVEAYTRKN